MTGTVEQEIFRALVERFRTWTLPTGWTLPERIAFPGMAFTIPTVVINGAKVPAPFVSLEVHFNRSIETDLSLELDPIRQGFMRANVMWPKGQGHVGAIEVAGSIRAHFRRGTKATEDDTTARIDEDPEIGVIVTGDTHFNVPVTIRWRCYPA